MIQRVTKNNLYFGVNDIRDEAWDKAFPVLIVRIVTTEGVPSERTVRATASTFKRNLRRSARGWVIGTTSDHIELRNGKRGAQ